MSGALPIVVDLDGTLIRSDVLVESALVLIKRNPLYLMMMLAWLLRGRARLKAEVAARVDLDAALLPYNAPLLDWLRSRRQAGHLLWLCTASDAKPAHGIASHVGLFDGVMASDGNENLKGRHKAERLVERFGERGFLYCGDSPADIAVWSRSAGAVVVGASKSTLMAAGKKVRIEKVLPAPRIGVATWLRALRVHQWTKNVLVFVPVAAAHRLGEPHALVAAFAAFVAFSLCASAVYVLNDLVDLDADRAHPRKRTRPFAAGDLPLARGLLLAALLLAAAAAVTALLPWVFGAGLALYFALTTAYSLYLKRVVMLDVLVLAALYTFRIIGGALATGIVLTFWLLMLSIFIFLSLALVKRAAELRSAARDRADEKAPGRGYTVHDLGMLQTMGIAAGYISVLVLALYISGPETSLRYAHPHALWLLCPILLYWISRIWIVTNRGFMRDDPLVFTFRDRVGLSLGAFGALAVWLAI